MTIEELKRNPKCWSLASNDENNIGLSDERLVHPFGSAKFSTNGAVKGSYGPIDIRGILGDHSGNMLLRFSKSIGVSSPTSAELLAIK
ncbi:hypothetical protein V6N12_050968 [Hibiscus sabdariffa]|uniref:Uncharacterized protein n=1 Tax=Hibiscus sabdariffa TaxID=183260 RepID=A0ABR2GF60_9ROSI